MPLFSRNSIPKPKTCRITLTLTSDIAHFFLHLITILKGKRNAYFEFLNVGFILRTLFFLISENFTH